MSSIALRQLTRMYATRVQPSARISVHIVLPSPCIRRLIHRPFRPIHRSERFFCAGADGRRRRRIRSGEHKREGGTRKMDRFGPGVVKLHASHRWPIGTYRYRCARRRVRAQRDEIWPCALLRRCSTLTEWCMSALNMICTCVCMSRDSTRHSSVNIAHPPISHLYRPMHAVPPPFTLRSRTPYSPPSATLTATRIRDRRRYRRTRSMFDMRRVVGRNRPPGSSVYRGMNGTSSIIIAHTRSTRI